MHESRGLRRDAQAGLAIDSLQNSERQRNDALLRAQNSLCRFDFDLVRAPADGADLRVETYFSA